jgi:hypothetical protein
MRTPLKCRTATRSRGYMHIWQFSASSKYSTKSAYEALFIGGTHFNPWERIWMSWAPGKCKFLMWTIVHKKCWIADRLARKGLIILKYVHCVIRLRKQLTICWSHVFSPCQMWLNILQEVDLHAVAPQVDDLFFED